MLRKRASVQRITLSSYSKSWFLHIHMFSLVCGTARKIEVRTIFCVTSVSSSCYYRPVPTDLKMLRGCSINWTLNRQLVFNRLCIRAKLSSHVLVTTVQHKFHRLSLPRFPVILSTSSKLVIMIDHSLESSGNQLDGLRKIIIQFRTNLYCIMLERRFHHVLWNRHRKRGNSTPDVNCSHKPERVSLCSWVSPSSNPMLKSVT